MSRALGQAINLLIWLWTTAQSTARVRPGQPGHQAQSWEREAASPPPEYHHTRNFF